MRLTADGMISGQVRGSDKLPVAGARVRAYVVRLRNEEPLGAEVITDADGQYRIRTGRARDGDREPRPNIRVAVVDRAGVEQVSSAVRFGIGANGPIDLMLPPGPGRASEFERYSAALAPVLQGMPLVEAGALDGAFIAGATGIPNVDLARLVEASARADAQGAAGEEASSLPVEVWYGWQREGLDVEPAELWGRPTDELLDALRRAVDGGVVPARIAEDLEGVGARIEQLKLDHVLQMPVLGTPATLGDLLGTLATPLDLDQQRAIAGAVSDLRPDDSQLVERIGRVTGFDGDPAAVARTFRLGALTGGDLAMTGALQSMPALAEDTQGSLAPLAALRPDEWLDLAYAHGPSDGPATTLVDYADGLAAAVEEQYPTAALAAHLSDGRRLGRQPLVAQVGTYLQQHPRFDIATADVRAIGEQAALDGIPAHEQLVEGLHALQRLHVLEATWEESATLLENDVASPHTVIAAGPGQLTAMLDGQIAPDRVAELSHRALDLHNDTFGAFTAAFSAVSGPPVMPMPPGASPTIPDKGDPVLGGGDPDPHAFVHGSGVALVPRRPPPATRDFRDLHPVREGPTADPKAIDPHASIPPLASLLQRLFGAQDACACGDCGSVLSPAAYFVDVLKFIDDAGLRGWLCDMRRPDLLDLELSCNNTHTEVPAIDLALEILENAVALPLDIPVLDGTDIQAQLSPVVSDAVEAALAKTVRGLSGKLTATRADTFPEPGTSDWTVVDGHRRWTLTARPRDAVTATTTSARRSLLDIPALDLPAVVAALDGGEVLPGAKSTFVGLFARAGLDEANYRLTVTPLTAGSSWRLESQFVAELVLDVGAGEMALRTPAGEVWWETSTRRVIAAVRTELGRRVVPPVVRRMFEDRFGRTDVTIVATGVNDTWALASLKRKLELTFHPAVLTIRSLAYQSGEEGGNALAEPENHNPYAYERLKAATFPWSLPLDLPLEEVRLLVQRARSSRRRLIELMLPVGHARHDDPTRALEILGLSADEAELIAPQSVLSDADIYASWGLRADATSIWDASAGETVSADTPLGLLRRVSILLQQSQLDFEELKAALASRFVSGSAPPAITPDATCIPSEMRIDALTIGHLNRIHRFGRLRKRLGWAAEDVDGAIPDSSTLDAATLQRLANLTELRDLLELPLDVIIAWWDGSATAAEQKRGVALGLNVTSVEIEHALALLDIATPFVTPGEMMGCCERVAGLRRAGIAFEDLRYLLQHDETPGADITLDPQQLAQLARVAREAANSILVAPEPAALPATAGAAALARAEEIRLGRAAERRAAQEAATITALAARLGVARDLVDALLRTRLHDPVDPATPAIGALLDAAFLATDLDPPAGDAVSVVLLRLYKAAFLCAALKLTATDLSLLRTSSADARGLTALSFDGLPVAPAAAPANVAAFEQLVALVQLRARAPDLLRHYAARDPITPGAATELLGIGLQLEEVHVAEAAAHLGINDSECREPIAIGRLVELLTELKQLGATPAQANALTSASPDDAAATIARELLRSKYGQSSWNELIRPLADTLRKRQRDALVAFLVAERDVPYRQLRDADDLYEFYLIDVQTSSCLKTTRLLHATAALQLFIQRLLLNLEPGPKLWEDKRELWKWMHSYRIWEANRKVFLFPENWLLPELRDDKTAIFRQLESALTEHEPSPEAARDALVGYVEDLGDLAQISVIAMYEDRRALPGSAAQRTLHVVGRTPHEPYRYYWRTCAQFGTPKPSWSGWEALRLETANDFILPFVFDGEPHVAWPVLRKTVGEKKDDTRTFWEVQLAWARRKGNGWVKQHMSHDVLTVSRLPGIPEWRSFVFGLQQNRVALPMASNLSQDRVAIDCYVADDNLKKMEIVPEEKLGGPDHAGADSTDQDNVDLKVSGTVWETYTLETKEIIVRPARGVSVTLDYKSVHHAGSISAGHWPHQDSDARVDSEGAFHITADPLVMNNSEVTLTIRRVGLPPRVLKASLIRRRLGIRQVDVGARCGVRTDNCPR